MTVQIEQERLDFLLYTFFGPEKDPYISGSRKAYRDLCRTIRFEGQSGAIVRSEVDDLLKNEISALLTPKNLTQLDYDDWHKELCQRILVCYERCGIPFTVGQAQKWLNMTIKYLYILGGVDLRPIFSYCHVPLDNLVFSIAERLFDIQYPEKRWSRITDYSHYMDYQYGLRNAIRAKGAIPLQWEFENWLIEAKSPDRSGI